MADAQDEAEGLVRKKSRIPPIAGLLPDAVLTRLKRHPRGAAALAGLMLAGFLVMIFGADNADDGAVLAVPRAVPLMSDEAGRGQEPPRGAETARGAVLTGVGRTEEQTNPTPAPIAVPPGFDARRALAPAPDAELIEQSGMGYLPVIGRDGRKAWQVYAKPFDLTDKRPRIAIVVSNLGISAITTDAAINRLPPAVSLSFAHFKPRLNEWVGLARAAGHEVLLDLPLEPADFEHFDPGPNTLLAALEPEKNLQRLTAILSRGTGYVGLVGAAGSRFIQDRADLEPVLAALQRRGLVYVDNRSTPQSVVSVVANAVNLEVAVANRVLDLDPTRTGVDKRLADLEDAARRNGRALGLVQQPYPVVMERIGIWAQGLADRGFVLAPVSAVVTVPPPPSKSDEAGQKTAEPKEIEGKAVDGKTEAKSLAPEKHAEPGHAAAAPSRK